MVLRTEPMLLLAAGALGVLMRGFVRQTRLKLIQVMGFINLTMLLGVLVATLLVTIIVSYAVAVGLDHVPAFLPYISETGTYSPESSLFGLGMNIASFLYLVAVYLRYRELQEFRAMQPACGVTRRANLWASWLGCSSALGLCVVANFQVERVKLPHFLGAFFCFVGGSVYFGLQAWFSQKMCPAVSTMRAVRWRWALTALSAVSFIICLVTGFFAVLQYDGNNQLHWKPDDKGYALHCVSAVAEWALALIFIGSIITYVPEMKAVTVYPPTFRILVLEEVTAVNIIVKQ